MKANSATKVFDLQIKLSCSRGFERGPELKPHTQNPGLLLRKINVSEVVDFRVSRKPVVQGSFGHFEELLFVDGSTVFSKGPEPLPLTFFADDRGDLGDLDLPRCCFCPLSRFCGDFDAICRHDFCLCCFDRLGLPGLSEKETFL